MLVTIIPSWNLFINFHPSPLVLSWEHNLCDVLAKKVATLFLPYVNPKLLSQNNIFVPYLLSKEVHLGYMSGKSPNFLFKCPKPILDYSFNSWNFNHCNLKPTIFLWVNELCHPSFFANPKVSRPGVCFFCRDIHLLSIYHCVWSCPHFHEWKLKFLNLWTVKLPEFNIYSIRGLLPVNFKTSPEYYHDVDKWSNVIFSLLDKFKNYGPCSAIPRPPSNRKRVILFSLNELLPKKRNTLRHWRPKRLFSEL